VNSYQAAKRIEAIITTEYADDIKSNYGDAPTVFGKAKWRDLGIGGGDGSGIVWEGFYEWTKASMMDKYAAALKGTGLTVFKTDEWMIEIF
tara:strand:- start:441 stop:713 length:273 start_codon:yes stop_codon:yes gene_type:complete